MSTENRKKAGRKPRHDFTNPEFLKAVEAMALKGFNDKEIAASFGYCQQTWCDKKNEYEELREVLSRARESLNSVVRATYLKMALGKVKTKNVVTQYAKTRCQCEGADPNCEWCGGTGVIVSKNSAIVSETEIELPPNMQALAMWMYHHDPEWRKIQRKEDVDEDDIPTDIKKGVNIDAWIKKVIEEE